MYFERKGTFGFVKGKVHVLVVAVVVVVVVVVEVLQALPQLLDLSSFICFELYGALRSLVEPGSSRAQPSPRSPAVTSAQRQADTRSGLVGANMGGKQAQTIRV
jgi:hypothetical protein